MKDRPSRTLALDEIPESVRNAWIRDVGDRQPGASFVKAICPGRDFPAWYAINRSVEGVQIYWGGVWQQCVSIDLEDLEIA